VYGWTGLVLLPPVTICPSETDTLSPGSAFSKYSFDEQVSLPNEPASDTDTGFGASADGSESTIDVNVGGNSAISLVEVTGMD
jgi:hypothetical protein